MKKTIGASVMSLGLVLGLSGFAGATDGTIDTTGPDSYNRIESENRVEVDVENRNDLRFENENRQDARSGDAEVRHNTEGGDAETGRADNLNSLDVSATVDNSGAASAWVPAVQNGGGGHSASIERTGPDSYNRIDFENRVEVDVENNNDINISNNNYQDARSGDAEVHGNTFGGSATTGDAINTNETRVDLSVTN